ncbi:MAG: recombination-associated protein RdgC [Lentisphaeria bacterium]
MPFDRGTISFRVCSLPEELPKNFLEGFAANVAPSWEKVGNEPEYGWVSGRHLMEENINEDTCKLVGNYHLCLRQAERKIPSSLLNAKCRLSELQRMAENGTDHINRKEKKRIREEIQEELQPTMPVQLSGVYIAIAPKDHVMYTTATSTRQLDLVLEYFHKATGVMPMALCPEVAALNMFDIEPQSIPLLNISPELDDTLEGGTLGENFLTWLWFFQEEHDGILPSSKLGEFSLGIDGPLVFVAEGNGAYESTIRKGVPTLSAEAKAALMVGKKLRRAKLILARGKGEEWAFTFDANEFVFKGMKLPEGESLDTAGVFDERMTNLYIFQTVFLALFQRFIKDMTNPEKATEYQKQAKQWVQERTGR